jgi:hypothetical protein
MPRPASQFRRSGGDPLELQPIPPRKPEVFSENASVGSHSELNLNFTFRTDAPVAVLVPFGPQLRVGPNQTDVPRLPPPEPEPWDEWEPEYREAFDLEPGDPEPDPIAAEPWRHDWAPWLGGELRWNSSQWSYRTSVEFKATAESIHGFMGWLGPFITPRRPGYPSFVGHVLPFYAPRPYLLMLGGDELRLEDTNPPGTRFPEWD